MNVKPGDIAIIIADDRTQPSPLAGRMVEILHAAGVGLAPLPDGVLSIGRVGDWTVRFQNPVKLRMRAGHTRITQFATCPDRVLRPISGDGITETEVTALYTPTEIKRAKESVE